MKKRVKGLSMILMLLLAGTLLFTACQPASTVTPQTTKATDKETDAAITESQTKAPPQTEEQTEGQTDPPAETGDEKSGEWKVVFLEGTDSNSWRTQCEEQMQALADEYIAEGRIAQYKLMVANNDATTQISQMEQAIQDEVDLILINPVTTTGLSATIDKAKEAGIRVMSLDQHISHPDVISVTNDQYKWAKIQVEWFVEQIDGEGRIYRMEAIKGAPASDIREQAFDEVLAEYPDIEVIAQDYGFWDEGKGKEIMTQWIATDPNFDAILCQDGVAVGILEAIEEAGLPYPKAITSDEYIMYLKKWKGINDANPDEPLNAIIVENPPSIGVLAMKVGIRLLEGDELNDQALGTDPIDPDNVNNLFYDPTLIITNANIDEYYEIFKDAPDTAYIDTDMTDALVDEYFK